MTQESTASVPTDTDQKQRIVNAAIEWVYDQGCATALMDLETAVASYVGVPVDSEGEQDAKD